MDKVVLQAINLHKSYQQGMRQLDILKGLEISLKAGQRAAIVGVSGSGKSTLLHLLSGLEQADQGEVYISGQAVHGLSVNQTAVIRRQCIGFVYQFHHLLAEFTAVENVALPLLLREEPRKAALNQGMAILNALGMEDRALHKPGQLSGGERQRVAIARAFVSKPECVLMDEPTGNLDQQTAIQIQDLILELSEEFKIALVVATHNPSLATSMGLVFRLSEGRLFQEG